MDKVKLFNHLCKTCDFNPGDSNLLCDFFDDFKDEIEAMTFLLPIMFKNAIEDNFKIHLGILYIGRFFKNPASQASISMYSNKFIFTNVDPELIDMTIRCYEHWGNMYSLNCLKVFPKLKQDWLEIYKNQVIKDIQEAL